MFRMFQGIRCELQLQFLDHYRIPLAHGSEALKRELLIEQIFKRQLGRQKIKWLAI